MSCSIVFTFTGEKSREFTSGVFLDALIWMHRLGAVAQMGVDVIMREPNLDYLNDPTPVSVIIKISDSF